MQLPMPNPGILSRLKYKLLNLLRHNARASLEDLARELALTPEAVAKHIGELEHAGVILGYQAIVDAEKRAALLPALGLAQEIRGHVSPETMDRVAEVLGLPAPYVRGVATFYTMYNKRPVGRFLIQVCTNISCNLCGADEVMEAFLRYANTEPGETSEDGDFTVIEAECLAGCGYPTCVQINSRYFENVKPQDVVGICERLRKDGK